MISVVIPVHNEERSVALLYDELSATFAGEGLAWEAVFVDDDSPDGTAALLRRIGATDPRVRCLRRIGRRGLSSACIEGMLATAAPVVATVFEGPEVIRVVREMLGATSGLKAAPILAAIRFAKSMGLAATCKKLCAIRCDTDACTAGSARMGATAGVLETVDAATAPSAQTRFGIASVFNF